MAVDLNSKPHSLTHMGNMSFDEDKQLNTVELVGVDPNGDVRKVPVGFGGELKPDYTTIIDANSETYIYIGHADPGTATSEAKWRIKRIYVNGSLIPIQFAGGVASFTNIWDDRAGLSYS